MGDASRGPLEAGKPGTWPHRVNRRTRFPSPRRACIAAAVALALIAGYGAAAAAPDAKRAPTSEKAAPPGATTLPVRLRPWTGDWDGIVKRRTLRVLVVPSRTFYFVDRGTQRGLSHDMFKGFEDEINRKLRVGDIAQLEPNVQPASNTSAS